MFRVLGPRPCYKAASGTPDPAIATLLMQHLGYYTTNTDNCQAKNINSCGSAGAPRTPAPAAPRPAAAASWLLNHPRTRTDRGKRRLGRAGQAQRCVRRRSPADCRAVTSCARQDGAHGSPNARYRVWGPACPALRSCGLAVSRACPHGHARKRVPKRGPKGP